MRKLHFADVVGQRVGTHRFSPVQNKLVLSQPRPRPTAFPWLGVGQLEEGWEGAGREHRPSKGEGEQGKQEWSRRDGKLGGAPALADAVTVQDTRRAFPGSLLLSLHRYSWAGVEKRNRVGKASPEGKVLVLPAQQTQEIRSWGLPSQPETTRDNEGAARSLGSHHSGSHLYPPSAEVRIRWTQRAPTSLTYQDAGRASALESILQSREVLGVRPHPSLRGAEAAYLALSSPRALLPKRNAIQQEGEAELPESPIKKNKDKITEKCQRTERVEQGMA